MGIHVCCDKSCSFDTNYSFKESLKECVSDGWRWSVRVLNKHTDLISSCGILAITTCLLAGKLFKSMPVLIPRLAKIVFDFAGIIWLNVQIRDLIKSGQDLKRAGYLGEKSAVVETALKVFVKTVNIVLTCTIFTCSVVAACGLPQISLLVAMTFRPLGLSSLGLDILTNIREYRVNESLIGRLNHIEISSVDDQIVAKTMRCFVNIITNSQRQFDSCEHTEEEGRLATLIVRQLDTWTLETLQESFEKRRLLNQPEIDSNKLFSEIKNSMIHRQNMTKANLGLIALGYGAMGICRAFPESLVEVSTRWGMSVLYTSRLIYDKVFQYNLAERTV